MSAPELRIGVLLKARTFLSVASGREGFPADAVFYRRHDVDGPAFCIPGSTVKGVLRKSAAKVAHLLGLEACCSVRPEREYTCVGREGRLCDVHLVFGAPGQPRSRVEVTHFLPVSSPDEARDLFGSGKIWLEHVKPGAQPGSLSITRVGIYDKSGTASPGLLYTYEQLPPGTLFYGEIAIKALDERLAAKALKLVLAALANLRHERLGRAGLVDVMVVGASDRARSLAERDPVTRFLLNELERGWWG